mgnify:CR=1 FL=1
MGTASPEPYQRHENPRPQLGHATRPYRSAKSRHYRLKRASEENDFPDWAPALYVQGKLANKAAKIATKYLLVKLLNNC